MYNKYIVRDLLNTNDIIVFSEKIKTDILNKLTNNNSLKLENGIYNEYIYQKNYYDTIMYCCNNMFDFFNENVKNIYENNNKILNFYENISKLLISEGFPVVKNPNLDIEASIIINKSDSDISTYIDQNINKANDYCIYGHVCRILIYLEDISEKNSNLNIYDINDNNEFKIQNVINIKQNYI